jgi:hypothetical protein
MGKTRRALLQELHRLIELADVAQRAAELDIQPRQVPSGQPESLRSPVWSDGLGLATLIVESTGEFEVGARIVGAPFDERVHDRQRFLFLSGAIQRPAPGNCFLEALA